MKKFDVTFHFSGENKTILGVHEAAVNEYKSELRRGSIFPVHEVLHSGAEAVHLINPNRVNFMTIAEAK